MGTVLLYFCVCFGLACVFATFGFFMPLVANVLLSLISTVVGEQTLARFKGVESGCLFPDERDSGPALLEHIADGSDHVEHHEHGADFYVKIWGVLLVLLVISLLGPELEIKIVTLITAFGIAFVKAYLVIAHFMHLNVEKRIIHYMLVVTCGLMGVFVFGVAPDVHKHEGANWENVAAKEHIRIGLRSMMAPGYEAPGHGDEHGSDHGGAVAAAPAEPAGPPDGAQIFNQYCVVCHGADGQGNNGLAANFVSDKTRLSQDKAIVIASIKDGKNGDIGAMPPWGALLNDEQIEAVYSHVMTQWGEAEAAQPAVDEGTDTPTEEAGN
jgi:caa(3)-type oxidase subunit IV